MCSAVSKAVDFCLDLEFIWTIDPPKNQFLPGCTFYCESAVVSWWGRCEPWLSGRRFHGNVNRTTGTDCHSSHWRTNRGLFSLFHAQFRPFLFLRTNRADVYKYQWTWTMSDVRPLRDTAYRNDPMEPGRQQPSLLQTGRGAPEEETRSRIQTEVIRWTRTSGGGSRCGGRGEL